jgi:hypothetical protein
MRSGRAKITWKPWLRGPQVYPSMKVDTVPRRLLVPNKWVTTAWHLHARYFISTMNRASTCTRLAACYKIKIIICVTPSKIQKLYFISNADTI